MSLRADLLRTALVLVALLLAAFVLTGGARAQCQLDWQPGVQLTMPSGQVRAIETMANGDLVVAGHFEEAGAIVANNVALWNGSSWSPLGLGFDGIVHDLVVAANGDLFAAGEFVLADGMPASRVARWDGFGWSPLGSGLDGVVRDLELLANGDLIAVGAFQASGPTPMPLVARWDGAGWSPVGGGVVGTNVQRVQRMPNNGFAILGDFTSVGGVVQSHLAQWTGTAWSGFPFAVWSAVEIAAAPNGDLAIAGSLLANGSVTLGIWDGATLQSIGSQVPVGFSFQTLRFLANGDLLAGRKSNGIGPVHRWDGSQWTQVGGLPGVLAQALHERPSGEIVIGGGGNTNNLILWPRCLASFDGVDWDVWGAPPPQFLNMFANTPSGELHAAGPGGPPGESLVVRWNGAAWVNVGQIFDGNAFSLLGLRDGSLLTSGTFLVGGSFAYALRWSAGAWTPVDTGLAEGLHALVEAPDGTIYGGAQYGSAGTVLSFDGTSWQDVGTGLWGYVRAIAMLPNGNLLVAGSMVLNQSVAETLVQWDGTSWTAFGTPTVGRVFDVLVLDDGTVIAAGEELLAAPGSHVAAFDGSGWTQMSTFDERVFSLREMPGGDILATGRFRTAGTGTANGMARWNGSAWSAVGAGANRSVWRSGLTLDGELHVSGDFSRIGGVLSAGRGRAVTTCPAPVSTYGSGCQSPVGPVTLSPRSRPWSGSTFRTQVTGMPASSFAVQVVGSAQASVPLAPVLPQSLGGCSLLTTPDILGLAPAVAGVAEPTLEIPVAASLVGVQFFQQALVVEVDANFQLLTVSSSNGLAATVGFF